MGRREAVALNAALSDRRLLLNEGTMSEHCPGCRNSDPREQGVDPLGVRKTREERREIAEELVWRIDTVALLKPEEVRDLYAKALAGEYDTIFDGEPVNPSHGTQSKTLEHIALRQWQAMLKAKEKKG
jgi:hypothetical protein